MSSQQETMSARSVDEEALEEAFEEIERVRDDLRRKQSHYGTAGFRPGQTINPNGGDTTLGLSHDTKVRLAMSASTASMPGAFSNDEVSPRGSNLKPSQAQLEEISGLRERQKRRQQSNEGGMQTGATSTEPNEPSSSLYVDGCLSSNDGLSNRFMAMRDLAISAFPSSASVVDSFGTPARAALCWVANLDSYQIEVVQSDEYIFIERFALGIIYYHFVGTASQVDNGLSTSNWLRPIPVCQWDFLLCGNATDNTTVHSLLLPSLQLKGSIPSELALLTKLTHIDLAYNNLSGSVPAEFWNMSQLEVLDVSVNTLTGSISRNLNRFTNLVRLHLDTNSFSGIFPDIVQLTSLVYLKIGRNSLTVTRFFDLLNFTELEILDLSATFLTGTIPVDAFTHLPNLRYLELQATGLSGRIPSDLGERLEHLDISTTRLSGSFPTDYGNLSNLQYLSMAFMPLLIGTIPSEIGKLSKLESVDVSNNIGLTGTMPSEICSLRLKMLSKLAADDNIKCNCCTAR